MNSKPALSRVWLWVLSKLLYASVALFEASDGWRVHPPILGVVAQLPRRHPAKFANSVSNLHYLPLSKLVKKCARQIGRAHV